jgi:hypothetical protein
MGKFLWIIVSFAALAGCDQRRHLGDPLDPNGSDPDPTGGMQLQNLVARVARTYQCPAGRISNIDDVQSCGCNSSFDCDFAGGVVCTCDPGCVDERPRIDCADYALTFAFENGTPKAIARMTEVRLTIGELVAFEGGLECEGSDWGIGPGETSGILDVNFDYDTSNSRYAQPRFSYSCATSGPRDGSTVSNDPDYFGEPMPPAQTSGSALLEIRGLFRDGAPWELSASADL